jgi:thiamine-monophosphate kinase
MPSELSEIALIDKYFKRPLAYAENELGIGDDCALVRIPAGETLAVSADMLVAGRHFFPDVAPFSLGWKSLAVNLSDLAAMGALPRWAMLSLALPEINEPWLAEFARGFFTLADEYQVRLIGGDTTRGPLNISVQIMGTLPEQRALKRSAARVGDEIWVSSHLGTALLALHHYQGRIRLNDADFATAANKMHLPEPRVALALKLMAIEGVHAAIDISDGLSGDLGHLLTASGVGAQLRLSDIPKHPMIARLSASEQAYFTLAGGDEYELCFTAQPQAHQQLLALGSYCIGQITAAPGLKLLDASGQDMPVPKSWDHFTS